MNIKQVEVEQLNQNNVNWEKNESSDESDVNDEQDNNEYQDDILYEDIKIDEEDEKALEQFINRSENERKMLADYIEEKLKVKEAEIETMFSNNASVKISNLDEKVVELYKRVIVVLSQYRSWKVPKTFKIVSRLANWEQLLGLTDPDGLQLQCIRNKNICFKFKTKNYSTF